MKPVAADVHTEQRGRRVIYPPPDDAQTARCIRLAVPTSKSLLAGPEDGSLLS